MKIKKTIYIYRDSNTDEPFIFTSKAEADRQIEEDIQYDAERYHYSEEEIAECRKELEAYGDDEYYRGTYLTDHSFGYFTQEIEFEVDIDFTKGV